MATGLSSPLGITGIILIIIGIIMAIIGIVLLIANQNKDKPWYIWLLLVGGIVMGILGGIFLAVALSQRSEPVVTTTPVPTAISAQQAMLHGSYMHQFQPPSQQMMHSQYPIHHMGNNVHAIDDDTFDPDPEQTVTVVPGQKRRMVAQGPYGPGGQQKVVTGYYKPQTQLVYATADIPEHPVTVYP